MGAYFPPRQGTIPPANVFVCSSQDGRLFYAPVDEHPQKIIDLGTGTGIWALEVGDLYPGAEVLGLDLSPIQTPWVPPNVRFLVDDIEDDWLNGTGWDFAHFRVMANNLRNLEGMMDQVFTYVGKLRRMCMCPFLCSRVIHEIEI